MDETGDNSAVTNPAETEKTVGKLSRLFNLVVRRAQAAIFWERLWPRLVPPLCTGGLFLSASWIGIWQPLPPAARIAGVITFAAILLASPLLVKTESLHVTKDDALKRLDKNIGDPSRPAQMLSDRLDERNPPVAKKIWALHLSDMWNKWAGKFKAGPPHPGMSARDPFHIRHLVIACTIVTAMVAGGHRVELVAEAFNWSAPTVPATPVEVKAWVTPPENINKPALFLTEGTLDHTKSENKPVVHKNSVLTILIFGEITRVLVNNKEVPIQKTIIPRDGNRKKSTYQYEIQLTEKDTNVVIERGPDWHFEVTPDNAPTVRINSVDTKTISAEEENPSIQINCSADDDYGIQEGDVVIEPPKGGDPEATPLDSIKIENIPLPKHGLCSDGP